jgi:hypothetical protein
MSLDGAIQRIQDIVLSSTDVDINNAPDYPVDVVSRLPLAVTHLFGGQGQQDTRYSTRIIYNIRCDVHFDRKVLSNSYKNIDRFTTEFIRRLGGDPTLDGEVDTIIFPILFNVSPAQWDSVVTQMISFTIPVKLLTTPI